MPGLQTDTMFELFKVDLAIQRKRIGRLLRRRRKILHLTLQNVAEQVGVHHTQIIRYEKGEKPKDLAVALALAEVLELKEAEKKAWLELYGFTESFQKIFVNTLALSSKILLSTEQAMNDGDQTQYPFDILEHLQRWANDTSTGPHSLKLQELHRQEQQIANLQSQFLNRLHNPESQLVRFGGVAGTLPDEATRRLLVAIALFPKPVLHDAVIYIAGLRNNPKVAEAGLAYLEGRSLVRRQDQNYEILCDHISLLAANLQLEKEERERQVDWCVDFCELHGGEHWDNAYYKYTVLEEQLENVCSVLQWCITHDRYETVGAIFYQINVFTRIYGYWSQALSWLGWLNLESKRIHNSNIAVPALYYEAWININMGGSERLSKAETLLQRAWLYRKNVNIEMQFTITHYKAELYIRKGTFDLALYWLDQGEDLLNRSGLPEESLVWYRCESHYHRGVVYYCRQNLDRATYWFNDVAERGRKLNWQLFDIYTQNWLADIEIARMDKSFDETEQQLSHGLIVARRSRDTRRAAHLNRSRATLNANHGRIFEARRCAIEARDGFVSLGMQPEANEMNDLLLQLT